MKTFSKHINESGCTTADVNQGNSLFNTGVTNHLTPIGNILTNVKNLFSVHLGIVAAIAEDGVSLKLHCSRFKDLKSIKEILYNREIVNGTCLADYIKSQGLDICKPINVGQFYVVYFSPSDIAIAQPGVDPEQNELPCTEQLFNEVEILDLLTEDEEEELIDDSKKDLTEILSAKDKVKSAKKLSELIAKEISLPKEYYFAAVKDKAGNESIALRWKYTVRGGKNQKIEMVKSLINIYDMSKDGVFVQDFDKNSNFKLPDEVKTLIDNVLKFIDAKKTSDECIFSLSDKDDKDEKQKETNQDTENKQTDNINKENEQ